MNDGHRRHAARHGSATHTGSHVRPPRIVIVDDQLPSCKACEIIIQRLFSEVTTVTFQNRDLAWQELLRRDPDLLITDLNNENVPGQPGYTGMSGCAARVLHNLTSKPLAPFLKVFAFTDQFLSARFFPFLASSRAAAVTEPLKKEG